jgi:histidinol-phosphate phosphatase family protein
MMQKSVPCIILAGGKGTRLQGIINTVAKPMAPMGQKPFLHVLMDHFFRQGVKEFVLSLGHKADSVTSYFDKIEFPYTIKCVIEQYPLGTAGALRNVLEQITHDEAIVINGDTFFDLPIQTFISDARQSGTPFFMALKPADDPSRYGNIIVRNNIIISFGSKVNHGSLQNAGVYWLKTRSVYNMIPEGKSSLETDFFPQLIEKKWLSGKQYSGFFIDIGVPDDYFRAQNIFGTFFVDSSWTLFLDRDGVINKRIVGNYVKSIDEFEFEDGALETIAKFSKLFGRIIVVTNQQGIGKGIMTESNLFEIHRYMSEEIERHGGRIDAVYYAPALASEQSELRKPNTGMAYLAQKDFPEIDFQKSVMIGDSDSDILFGQALGMITVKLDSVDPSDSKPTIRRKNLKMCINLFETAKMK